MNTTSLVRVAYTEGMLDTQLLSLTIGAQALAQANPQVRTDLPGSHRSAQPRMQTPRTPQKVSMALFTDVLRQLSSA